MMDVRSWQLPFRVGATSYSIEDDLLGNARFLAGQVQDMQLVLFDLPGGQATCPMQRRSPHWPRWGPGMGSPTLYTCSTIWPGPHMPHSPPRCGRPAP